MRALLAEPAFDPSALPHGDGREAGQWLRTNAPATVAWKEFDHNAATTALYAAYESSVFDLLREWIVVFLPKRWPAFIGDLPDAVRTAYIGGIAAMIPKLNKGRYSSLKVEDVALEFANATAGNQPYRLHPEAFFTDDQNLRGGRLNELLRSVGIDDGWGWVCKHPLLIDYIDNAIGGENSLDSELNRFVQARNDAAHGSTGLYLGISQLEQLAELAERLGVAVVEKARSVAYDHLLSVNQAEDLGVVSEVFAKANAAILIASGKSVSAGESLGLLSSNCCDYQRLQSCQVDGTDHNTLVPVEGQQIGLRFVELPREGARAIRVLPSVGN